MSKIIKFTNIFGIDDIYPPEPASKNIPEWYKYLGSYIKGKKAPDGSGETTATIKKCMPVFDAINSGYIIKTPVDIYVSQKPNPKKNEQPDTIPHYEWAGFGMLKFHPVEQAPNYPNPNGYPQSYPKWMNPWAIETPKGYSSIFVQPWHRDSVFTILPGIVDTDTYTAPVNFPFFLNDMYWQGLIPAGTPIAQVIPFKRDKWKMGLGGPKDIEKQSKVIKKLGTTFFDAYKNQFRQPKEYR